MPLFANKPAGDAADWEPQAADSRLAHTAGVDPSGVFTSDLSVSEYVLGWPGWLSGGGDRWRWAQPPYWMKRRGIPRWP